MDVYLVFILGVPLAFIYVIIGTLFMGFIGYNLRKHKRSHNDIDYLRLGRFRIQQVIFYITIIVLWPLIIPAVIIMLLHMVFELFKSIYQLNKQELND